MAKQVGPLFFTGTIDGLIFYKLGDHYYIRSKGSYKSAKHMRRNPKYQRTLQQADRFGEASQLLQEVYYRQLPKAVRKHGLYGKLTGMINSWLYQGKSKEEVKELLMAHCKELASSVTLVAPKTPTQEDTVKGKEKTEATNLPSSPMRKIKQARYLSRWKVKRNGRLHIPKQRATCLPAKDHVLPDMPAGGFYSTPAFNRDIVSIQLE